MTDANRNATCAENGRTPVGGAAGAGRFPAARGAADCMAKRLCCAAVSPSYPQPRNSWVSDYTTAAGANRNATYSENGRAPVGGAARASRFPAAQGAADCMAKRLCCATAQISRVGPPSSCPLRAENKENSSAVQLSPWHPPRASPRKARQNIATPLSTAEGGLSRLVCHDRKTQLDVGRSARRKAHLSGAARDSQYSAGSCFSHAQRGAVQIQRPSGREPRGVWPQTRDQTLIMAHFSIPRGAVFQFPELESATHKWSQESGNFARCAKFSWVNRRRLCRLESGREGIRGISRRSAIIGQPFRKFSGLKTGSRQTSVGLSSGYKTE